MEQDLADRFEVSQSTISKITNTWMNFIYLQFKEMDLWPSMTVCLKHLGINIPLPELSEMQLRFM